MMPSPHEKIDGPTGLHPTTDESTRPRSRRILLEAESYHPTAAFRRILNQSARDRKRRLAELRGTLPRPSMSGRVTRLLRLLGIALLLSVTSGLLELAVLEIQLHLRHRVDWFCLMVSRHIAWMLPVTAPLVIIPIAVMLVCPAFALLAWRKRRGRQVSPLAVAWVHGWAGTVLGSLFFIGPLLATRALHPVAAVALAVGLGFRLWPGLVRRDEQPEPPRLPGRGCRNPGRHRRPFAPGEFGHREAGSSRVPTVGRRSQPALDRRGHSPRGSHEHLRVRTPDDARAR